MIRSAGYGFELASDGSAGKDDVWISSGELGGSQWTYSTVEGTDVLTTSEQAPFMNWLMTANSNLKNSSGSGSGLNPSASGTLTFYVIPDNEEEELPLGFSLSMQAYRSVKANETIDADKTITVTVEENEKSESKSVTAAGDIAAQLLNGHVLFFQNRTGTGSSNYVYSDWIQDGYFTKKLSSENEDANVETASVQVTDSDGTETTKKAYKITIYWVWPYVLGQMLLPNGDDRLSGRTAIISEEDKSAIIEDMVSMVNIDGVDRNKYFYDYDSLPTSSELTQIAQGSAQNGFSVTTFNKISAYYNKADQYIGDNINYVVVQLIADVAQ